MAWCLGISVAAAFAVARPASVSAVPGTIVASPGSNPHQWGAVTLFHGLPSDHVRAIEQGPDGTMWFGTDSGLVKYDGRRIQRLATDGPAAARVLALQLDRDGVLWIGTDAGAARVINGEIKPIPETRNSAVTAIITPEAGRALMTTEQGEIFDCATAPDGSSALHKIKPEDHPLLTIESRGHAPLRLTSLALIDKTLIVGTRSRGLLRGVTKRKVSGGTRSDTVATAVTPSSASARLAQNSASPSGITSAHAWQCQTSPRSHTCQQSSGIVAPPPDCPDFCPSYGFTICAARRR